MLNLAIRGLLIFLVLYMSVKYIEGISITAPPDAFWSTFLVTFGLFVIAEVLAYPLLNSILFPIRVLTLGVASLFIAVLVISFIANFYEPFVVASLFEIFVLAILFAIVRFGTD